MKKLISILTIFVIMILPLNAYGQYMDNTYMDIKIGKSYELYDYINLSSDTSFFLFEKDDLGREIAEIDEDNIIITYKADMIDIMDSTLNILESIPADGSIVIGTGDNIIKVGENRYRDYISFLIKDKIQVINYIHIENYLYGVVPREMPASSHIEALKAQSIVARSYAYRNIGKHRADGFDLCDTTHCQVYMGYDNEHKSTNEAIDQTYGEYVTYNGDIIETPYHSTSGGKTVSSVDSWGGNLPYLIGVEDEFSANSPNSSWTVEFSLKDMESKLLSAGIYVGEIQDIEVLDTTKSNRVKNLNIIGSNKTQTISGVKMQSTLNLKSRWFDIETEGDSNGVNSTVYVVDGNSIKPISINLDRAYVVDGKNRSVSRSGISRVMTSTNLGTIGSVYSPSPTRFVVSGRGYGHGVGMSQYGAMEMAKQGFSYKDIITHYYSGVEIINIGK
ncbi:SpoIID/LytB domain-containing protein [Tissierella creatinini]|nr:SpoIID/LytB domain-containing protein [Tissierella creatinini]TJX69243.1 SpoIID/LytB domain-containing protein [Soehngenia saccharolytica]